MDRIQTSIFQGLDDSEYREMVESCTREKSYAKQQTILRMGDRTRELGLVIEGSVLVESIDAGGNTSIMSKVGAGDVFAEAYAIADSPMMVQVVAELPSRVMFVDVWGLVQGKYGESSWASKMVARMLEISARKNMTLSQRIFCTSPKRIRDRVLTYLSQQSIGTGSTAFSIPFDRQQLADYLNVDRSALSKELGRMRDEGIIDFHKNRFQILDASGMGND